MKRRKRRNSVRKQRKKSFIMVKNKSLKPGEVQRDVVKQCYAVLKPLLHKIHVS